jgi:Na+-driven multidrug efflux pump
VEIGPECIASAATVRVEHNLSRGNIETAKKIANRTLVICTALALVISLLLLDTRNYLAWCFSLDETLEEMIYEIIPYIAICQPFITVGVTAEYLNEALGKYKMSVKISAFIDAVFTYPIAAIFTYELNYNIEGLASAVCMGYAATGITNLIIYANTNWERATVKIQRYTEEG